MFKNKRLQRGIANFIQKAPWLMVVATTGLRITQPKFTAGTVGVIFNDQGKLLLVEHVLHPRHPWGLPGGWVNRNEQPFAGVIREIHEELGIIAEVQTLLLCEIHVPHHLDFAYLCDTADYSVNKLSNELLAYDWFDPLNTPPLLIFHQRAIQQALTIRQLMA